MHADAVIANDASSASELEPDVAAEVDEAHHPPQPQPAAEVSDRFLPNAIPIYGTQHGVDNMTRSVHCGLGWWPNLHAGLKHLEAMLSRRDRRERFIWTCLRGTVYEYRTKDVNSFSQHLYEGRWKEVCMFIKHLKPILPALRHTFNARKYRTAVDGDRSVADAAFNPEQLADDLNSNLWNRYLDFVIEVEKMPVEGLAQWCEGCSCHEPLLLGISDWHRQTMMRRHYGPGATTCPLSGLRSAEMACGRHLEILRDCWERTAQEILVGTAAERRRLTDDELSILQQDMDRAKAMLEVEMRTKFDFWQRLPWKICGLAHRSEEVARDLAREILQDFQIDARQEAHHPKTWALMCEGSAFREGLQQFLDGRPRWECGEAFTTHISICRLFPVAETTIEAKHAHVSLEGKKHHIGPVRVSLANRRGMMEKMLLKDPSSLEGLLQSFQVARTMNMIAPVLGLQGHPLLVGPRRTVTQLRVVLAPVIYNCDLEGRYSSLQAEIKTHKAGQHILYT